MLVIEHPQIVKTENGVKLSAVIRNKDDIKELWIETEEQYAKYYINDRCDGFLLAMLPIAMRTNQDITCNAPVSEELLHNLQTQLIPTVVKNSKALHKIKIYADINSTPIENEGAVGTGISRGVDSMHVLKNYINPEFPSLKLTHLCLFDVGAFSIAGYNERGQLAEVKQECFKKAEEVANELHLPIIKIKSNLATDFRCMYVLNSNYCNLFPVLCLQKLWKTYFYGSSYDFSFFTLKDNDRYDCAHYELLLTNCLSTSNLKIYSEGGEKNRLEKTSDIADFEPAQKHLHVCITNYENCNRCIKCRRTLLALDALGKLDNFKDVFDIEYYKHNKKMYINYLQQCHDKNDEINEPTYAAFTEQHKFITSPPKCFIKNVSPAPIQTKSVLIKNLKNNETIASKNIDEYCTTVGFAKIMTALIAIEYGDLTKELPIPSGLIKGFNKATLCDLVNMQLITSNNTVSDVIAQHISGSITEFINLMNMKAAEIGLKNTVFTSTIGLKPKAHITAEDAAKLMEYALQNNHFYEIYTKNEFTITEEPKEKTLVNSEPLTNPQNEFYIKECIGTKSGIYGKLGNMSALLKKGDNLYLLILMDSELDENYNRHFIDTKQIVNDLESAL